MEKDNKKFHGQVFFSAFNRKSLFTAMQLLFACLFCFPAFAQNQNITGIVKDATGETIIGANVQVKGTTVGTITDIDGGFTLNVPATGTLVVSYLGYKTLELPLGQTTYNIVLQEDSETLDEVVVIGYGVVKKRDLTGAISQVNAEKLMATAPVNIQDALRGKAAGVMVASGNGVNDLPMIRVRGNRSISATNDPLFVIDGVPVNGGMETINPNDVLSMEILKDASATAIYGARGANGVIIVTTKKGEAGKVNVEYNGYVSLTSTPDSRWKNKTFNAAGFVDYIREGNRKYIYDGQGGYQIDPESQYPSLTPNWDYDKNLEDFVRDQSGYVLESLRKGWANGNYDPSLVRGFDWEKLGKRNPAFSHNHSISIRGGSENTKVYVSGSFMDGKGYDHGSYRKRYTLRMNLDQNLGERITMGATTNFSYYQYYNGQSVWGTWNPLGNPYYSLGGSGLYGIGGDVTKDGDPSLGIIPYPTGETLWANHLLNFDNVDKVYKRNRLDATIYATVKLYDGLTYRANFGTDLAVNQDLEFAASGSQEQGFGDAKAVQKRPITRGWTFENILNYAKTFNDHSINATVVQSSQKYMDEKLEATGIGLPIESQKYYQLQSATNQSIDKTDYSQWTMMSWMGRIIYGFKDSRYMLTASLRYDGSSRLAKGHQWVAFPSASVAWRISDEGFLRGNEVLSNLKLRFGYGKTGNSAIDPYSTIGKITPSRYTWGDNGIIGYAPSSLSNSTLTWETTGQYNVGLDFGLFNGRVSGSLEYYLQKTHDLLMPRSLPQASGFSNITQNIGETENQGFEVSLETVNITNKDFEWTTNLQFATNKEKIVKLATGQQSDIANNWYVGKPVDSYYDYVKTDRVWGYSKEDMDEMAKFNANGHNFKPGDYRVKDLNGDYKITEEDRDVVGQRMPKVTIGLANTFRYKNFDLYLFLTGMFGHTLFIGSGYGHGGRYNTRDCDYWTPENTNTIYRKPEINAGDGTFDSAYKYHKGDFVKVSDISLGYTIPRSLMNQIGVERARFYVQVQNPFIFTSYIQNNPEGFTGNTRKWDNTYEEANNNIQTVSYLFGVNITF